MSSDKSQKIKLIYEWVTAALLIATAAALIIGCVSIYLSGEKPFSRDAVSETFARFAPLVYVTAAFSVGGIFTLLLPSPSKKKTSKRQRPASVLAVSHSSGKDRIVTAIIITVGGLLLVIGLIGGGAADVLAKAVNICTECIGLG